MLVLYLILKSGVWRKCRLPVHYTGEYSGDYNELVYLRARFYAPGMGRFLTRDTWGGTLNRPMSHNRWNYVESNPINRTDPSGLCWYPNPQTGGILIDSVTPSPN